MSRLIIIPQYPMSLRYQEWWITEFPKNYRLYFDDVISIRGSVSKETYSNSEFSKVQEAIDWETTQIKKYMNMEIQDSDILLLNDISFPGLFPMVLFHKRPKRCFAICHATSKNNYDYFEKVRDIKFPIERISASLFTNVFVATEYHQFKLCWNNLRVTALPDPPVTVGKPVSRRFLFVVASRMHIQKRTMEIEDFVQDKFATKIITTKNCTTWEEYYETLSSAKILLITSKEETYGYQVVDAIRCGCYVVAPNDFSYPELLDKMYLYDNVLELETIVRLILQEKISLPKNLMQDKVDHFFEKTAKFMLNE